MKQTNFEMCFKFTLFLRGDCLKACFAIKQCLVSSVVLSQRVDSDVSTNKLSLDTHWKINDSSKTTSAAFSNHHQQKSLLLMTISVSFFGISCFCPRKDFWHLKKTCRSVSRCSGCQDKQFSTLLSSYIIKKHCPRQPLLPHRCPSE